MSQSQKLKLLIHGYEIRVRGHKKEIETYGADSVIGAFACQNLANCEMVLEALRGWEAVEKLINHRDVSEVCFGRDSDRTRCEITPVPTHFHWHEFAPTPAQAAIAAAEKVGGE